MVPSWDPIDADCLRTLLAVNRRIQTGTNSIATHAKTAA